VGDSKDAGNEEVDEVAEGGGLVGTLFLLLLLLLFLLLLFLPRYIS